jgi:hypothetical protein
VRGARDGEEAQRFALPRGASWLKSSGEVLPIPGFHEEWIRAHQDMVEGAANVCEVVLGMRWISVALFDGGYLELMVPDRRSPGVVSLVGELLSRNAGEWRKALVMSMDEEGYVMIGPEDARDPETLARRLASPM